MQIDEKDERSDATMKALLLTFVIIAVYLFISSRTTLWDRDEPRYARATVEMVTSGNYIYPTFNGNLFPDKPILVYWLMSIPVRIFGPTELACRMFSAIGTGITCFLTFLIGMRLLGSKAGLISMVVLASSAMMAFIGTASVPDGVLLPCIVGAMAVFIYALTDAPRWHHLLLMSALLGLGMLAKGPVGLFPVPCMLAILWMERTRNSRTIKLTAYVFAASIIAVGIFLAWALPADHATGGEFLKANIGHHVGDRIVNPMESHGGNRLLFLPYYFPMVIAGFFPWTLFLAGTISAALGNRLGSVTAKNIMICWAVPIFVAMSFVATKLPHYILFIWPAMSLAVAATFIELQKNTLNDRDKLWLQRGGWFFAPVAVGTAIVLILGPFCVKQLAALQLYGIISGIILLVTFMLTIREHLKNNFVASAKTVLVGMAAFMVPFVFGVLPAIEKMKISPVLAAAVNARPADIEVATFKYAEPTLNFYIGRQLQHFKDQQQVADWLKNASPGILIVPRSKLAEIESKYNVSHAQEIASVCGLNYSNGSNSEIIAVLRNQK